MRKYGKEKDANHETRNQYTRWFKYDRDYLCVNKSQFVSVIFEPPCLSSPFRVNILFGL
jgi:hypothetical protein